MPCFAALLAILTTCFAVSLTSAATPSQQLRELIFEAWEFDLNEYPQFATAVGDHRNNDSLGSVTVADEVRRAEFKQDLLERLEAIDRSELSASEQLNRDILARDLRDTLSEFEFKSYLLPISNRSGFHIEFPDLPTSMPLKTTSDYENYIARLGDFLRYAREHIVVMRTGIREGYTLPAVILEGFEDTPQAQLVDDPTKSLLYAPLIEFPATVPADQHERLRKAAAEAIATSVVPAYREFLKFMQNEYVPACRASVGASALPQGRDFYRYRVRKFTTLDDATPEAIHQRGLAEVKRIRAEMDEIIERVGFEGDFAAFVKHLRTDSRYYPQTKEELLEKTALILKRADGELPKLFGRLPRMPYGIREIPAYIAPKTTSAYYMPPSGDRTRAGFYYVNTYNLPSRGLYDLEALSLHEAVPGHHLQIALQQELEDLPEFRKFGGSTAFIEGWALYSERLGFEMGFYEDPYSDFGRLSMEIWRACRLVVDTGMHYFDWSRDDAIKFMLENSAMSEHNIRAEVDRYIGWPGQALAYKTGELKIRELRAKAEKELGTKFDVRGFHDVVLGSGAVPLGVLEQNVNHWIAEQQ
jgi:uncharacterized protein (DUF885 family)